MNLTEREADRLVEKALSCLGRPYADNFRCVDFAREVYGSIGIRIPKLTIHSPPRELNISREELANPPQGRLLFLKDRTDPRANRAWTHVVITLGGDACIHCSLFQEKVCIGSIAALMAERYDFAESIAAP